MRIYTYAIEMFAIFCLPPTPLKSGRKGAALAVNVYKFSKNIIFSFSFLLPLILYLPDFGGYRLTAVILNFTDCLPPSYILRLLKVF